MFIGSLNQKFNKAQKRWLFSAPMISEAYAKRLKWLVMTQMAEGCNYLKALLCLVPGLS